MLSRKRGLNHVIRERQHTLTGFFWVELIALYVPSDAQ